MNYTLLLFNLNFILIIIFFFLNFKDLKKTFQKIGKKSWILLLVLLLVYFLFLTSRACNTYTLTSPSNEYNAIAKNIVINQDTGLCNAGSINNCIDSGKNVHPIGYHYVISIIFSLFGFSLMNLIYFQIIISVLTIFLVFLITYLLLNKVKPAFLSVILLMFSTYYATKSFDGGVAVEFFSIFMVALCMLLFLFSYKSDKTRNYLITTLVLVFAMSVRDENVLLLPFYLIFFMVFKRVNKIHKMGQLKKILIPMLIFSPFFLLHFYTLFGVSQFVIRPIFPTFSIRWVAENFMVLWGELKPHVIALALLLPAIIFIRDKWKPKLFLLGWFLQFFVIFLFYYSPHRRLWLQIFIPMVLLIGYGAYLLIRRRGTKTIVFLLLIFFFIVGYLFVSHHVPSTKGMCLNYEPTVEELHDVFDMVEDDAFLLVEMGNIKNAILLDSDVNVAYYEESYKLPLNIKTYFLDVGLCGKEFFQNWLFYEVCENLDNSSLIYKKGDVSLYLLERDEDLIKNMEERKESIDYWH